MAYQAEIEGLGDSIIFLQINLGLAWTVGCLAFSMFVLHKSTECRIARQYLCQAAVFMCGISILAFTLVNGNYQAYVMFAWIYGKYFSKKLSYVSKMEQKIKLGFKCILI